MPLVAYPCAALTRVKSITIKALRKHSFDSLEKLFQLPTGAIPLKGNLFPIVRRIAAIRTVQLIMQTKQVPSHGAQRRQVTTETLFVP